MILPRKTWVTIRNKAGVPSGAVRSVSIGKKLDAYWNAANSGEPKKELKAAEDLLKAFQTYHKKISADKKHKGFAPTVKNEIDEVTRTIKSIKAVAAPTESLRKNVLDVVKLGKAVPQEPTQDDYRNFWHSDPVRLIWMNGGQVAKQKPDMLKYVKDFKLAADAVVPDKVADREPKFRHQAVEALMRRALLIDKAAKKINLWK